MAKRNASGIARRNIVAILLAIAFVVACAATEVSARLVVHAAGATARELALSAEILNKRFEEMLPSRRSNVSAAIAGDAIEFTFRGDGPSERQLRYLAMTRGELRIFAADMPAIAWASDADVEDARAAMSAQGAVLNVRLTEQAGQKLAENTSKNVGRRLVVTWEGQTVVAAPIRGPFGRDFQFTVPSADEGRLMSVILRGGRLPVVVAGVEYDAQRQ